MRDRKDLPERSFQLRQKELLTVRAENLLCSLRPVLGNRDITMKRKLVFAFKEHVNWWRALICEQMMVSSGDAKCSNRSMYVDGEDIPGQAKISAICGGEKTFSGHVTKP